MSAITDHLERFGGRLRVLQQRAAPAALNAPVFADLLTGLPNRGAIVALAHLEFRRRSEPMALIILDLDYFRQVILQAQIGPARSVFCRWNYGVALAIGCWVS
jgi:PleD family two-component response regulator